MTGLRYIMEFDGRIVASAMDLGDSANPCGVIRGKVPCKYGARCKNYIILRRDRTTKRI